MQHFLLGTLVGYIGRSVKISDSVDAMSMARCIGLLRSNGLLRNSRVGYDTVLQLETSLNCLGFTLNYNLYLPSPCEACPISQIPTSLHYTPSIFRPHVSSMAKETPANKRHSASEASASTGPRPALVLPPKTTFLRLPRPSALAAEVRATNKWGPMPGTSSSQ